MFESILTWSPQELSAIKPRERLTVTEWACKKRELAHDSAIQGLYPIEMTPFFRGPMDRCGSPDIEMQVLMGPAQIGKTVAVVENTIGYYTEQEPSAVIVVFADEETAKFAMVEKIGAMFKDSSELNHLYDKRTFLTDRITTYNGARIDAAWASSVAKLATKAKRIVIGDEVDKAGYYARTKEASALSLMRERTRSFPRGYFKHVFCSTPTIEEGNIITLLSECDVIYDWHAKCPNCGIYQPLRWDAEYVFGFPDKKYRDPEGVYRKFGMVVWSGGRNATLREIKNTARYKCGSCEALWTNDMKNFAVSKGVEAPRTDPPEEIRRVGNVINRIYSLADSGNLDILVADWCRIFRLSKDVRIGELQGFVNSTLAEPFSMVRKIITQSEESILTARTTMPPQVVPEEAIVLVAYIDNQKYDFWYTVRAFAADYTSWLIDYGQLLSYEDVETLLFDTFYTQTGTHKQMRIVRAGLDTGGGEGRYENVTMTEEAYAWLRRNQMGRGCRVFGMKGSSLPFPGGELVKVGKPLDKTPAGKPIPEGLQIISVDTFKLKTMFHLRLKAAIDGDTENRPAYLHKDVRLEYAKQILSEKLQVDEKGKEEWVKIGSRANHLLDCEANCIALVDPEWPGGGLNVGSRRATVQRIESDRKSERKSGFLPETKGWMRR